MATIPQSRQIANLNFTHHKLALTPFFALLTIRVAEISTLADNRSFHAVKRASTSWIGESADGSSAVKLSERGAGPRAHSADNERLETSQPATLYSIVARPSSLEVFCAPDAGNGYREFSGGCGGAKPPTSRPRRESRNRNGAWNRVLLLEETR
jgi:hypothetical protein